MDNRRWLITGGSGFLGLNLIRYLKDTGCPLSNIRVLENSGSDKRTKLQSLGLNVRQNGSWSEDSVSLCQVDIGKQRQLDPFLDGADIVVHLAAETKVPASIENPELDFETNTIGTYALLESARRVNVERVIFTSSVAGYALEGLAVDESSTPFPLSPYGASKLCGEMMTMAWARSFNMHNYVLRLSNLVGPMFDSSDGLVPRMIKSAINESVLEIYGDGTATRDFISTHDVCSSIMACTCTPTIRGSCELYQISSGETITVNQAVAVLNALLEKRGLKPLAHRHVNKRHGDIFESAARNSKAIRELNWKPQLSFSQTLDIALDWYLHS